MLEYLKDYGISDDDFSYIVNNVNEDILENLILSELIIKNTLSFYNKIGIDKCISSLIVYRPDLVLIDVDELKDIIKNIDKHIFVNLVNNDIEDLVLFGI